MLFRGTSWTTVFWLISPSAIAVNYKFYTYVEMSYQFAPDLDQILSGRSYVEDRKKVLTAGILSGFHDAVCSTLNGVGKPFSNNQCKSNAGINWDGRLTSCTIPSVLVRGVNDVGDWRKPNEYPVSVPPNSQHIEGWCGSHCSSSRRELLDDDIGAPGEKDADHFKESGLKSSQINRILVASTLTVTCIYTLLTDLISDTEIQTAHDELKNATTLNHRSRSNFCYQPIEPTSYPFEPIRCAASVAR